MSWILDIIIVAIAAGTIYFSAKNGFIKTAISALAFLAAIVITAMFTTPVADWIKNTSVAETVETATEEAIINVLDEGSYEISSLLNGESEEFNKLVTIAQLDREELKSWYNEKIDTSAKDGKELLAKRLSAPIIDTVAVVIAVIVLFFGTQILLSIAAYFLNKLAKLPVLRSFNKLFGIILGVILALLRVLLFCFVVNILIEHSVFLGSEFISSLSPESTVLFKPLSELDIFSFFL